MGVVEARGCVLTLSPPLACLLRLSPVLIHSRDPFRGLLPASTIHGRNHGFPFQHSGITREQQRLRFPVLLLASQTRAQQTLGVKPFPDVGPGFLETRESLARERL